MARHRWLFGVAWYGVTCTFFARLCYSRTKVRYGVQDMPSDRQRKLDAVVARLQLQYGPARRPQGRAPGRSRSPIFPPPSPSWMPRSAAGCRAGGSPRSSARRPPARSRWRPRSSRPRTRSATRWSPGSICRAPATPTTCTAAASTSTGCWSSAHATARTRWPSPCTWSRATPWRRWSSTARARTGAGAIPPSSPAAWSGWRPSSRRRKPP